MAYEDILYRVDGGVAVITLNRPDKLNAWRAEMERELRSAMRDAGADPTVRVIVLTGAGRGFCAGADMNGLQSTVAAGQARAGSTPAPAAPGPAPFAASSRGD